MVLRTHSFAARVFSPRIGFTLVELVGVLIILALVAGMVVPLVGRSSGTLSVNAGSGDQSAEQVVTTTTMQAIREVFVSSTSGPGLWADLGGVPDRLPRTLAQVFSSAAPLTGTPTPQPFDPVTQIGWRGPYMIQPTGTYPDIGDLHNPITGATWEQDGFTNDYENTGEATLIDAWGNPIVLQVDLNGDGTIIRGEAQVARIVSAGPNGQIDLPLSDTRLPAQFFADNAAAAAGEQIDDIVIYLGIGS